MAKRIETLINQYQLESKEGYYSLIMEEYGEDNIKMLNLFNDMKKDNKLEFLNVYLNEVQGFKDIVPGVRKLCIEEILI